MLLIVGAVLGTGMAWWLFQVGNAAIDLARAGAFSEVPEREYRADREGNLAAIHRALVLVCESEGALPKQDWKERAMLRLKTRDLSEAEAAKKMVALPPATHYRLSAEAAGKHVDDLPPDSVLVFESRAAPESPMGAPERGLLGVTAAGNVVAVGGK